MTHDSKLGCRAIDNVGHIFPGKHHENDCQVDDHSIENSPLKDVEVLLLEFQNLAILFAVLDSDEGNDIQPTNP